MNEEVGAQEKAKTGLPENGMRVCKKLEVLYLFENRISQISEVMLNFKKLTRLYMYDNCITKIENFENLVNLQKLYLEKNMIRRLEGL
jgi:Leucine-rich repeat (LRR) protein